MQKVFPVIYIDYSEIPLVIVHWIGIVNTKLPQNKCKSSINQCEESVKTSLFVLNNTTSPTHQELIEQGNSIDLGNLLYTETQVPRIWNFQ